MMLVLFGDKVLVLYLVKVAPSDAAVLAADAIAVDATVDVDSLVDNDVV